MTPPPPKDPVIRTGPPAARPVIGRQLALGFALVVLAVLSTCGVLLWLLGDVSGSVHAMRDGEKSVRQSLALAMAVREQYIHQAHTIVEGDHSHLQHYEVWLARVGTHARALAKEVPPVDGPLVANVLDESHELDRLFRQELVPALDRGDHAAVKVLHRRAEQLSTRAVADADRVAQRAEGRMADLHVATIGATGKGLATGAACMLAVIALSVYYVRRIRRLVLGPLESLATAARRFGRGDFAARIDHAGEGEFEAVSWAWNRMLEELHARERRVLQAERMAAIGQLAAGVAHEINNPIGVIRGYLRTMSPDEPPAELREELKILDDEAAACQRIAEDLLAYSRSADLSIEPVRMAELLSETARRFAESGEAGARGVEVDGEATTLRADARRLRQVILNLLRNAAQAAPDGTTIEVTGRRLADRAYEIRVLDRGPGVDAADVARIFEPFYSRHEGGSGLGLAVCLGIVRAHGGEIRVELRLSGGTAVVVTLPASPPETVEERP